MTADSQDGFEYIPALDTSTESERRHYWSVAIGLQAVDGLEVSPYLKSLSEDYIIGNYTAKQTGNLIRKYHQEDNANSIESKEADLVSQRIVELLSLNAFSLTQEFLIYIHKYIFQDLDEDVYRPGQFKLERLIKQEKILNGDSVLYADPSTYEMSLKAAFQREQDKIYTVFDDSEILDFCKTISFLWQVHPFYEGNTLTIAVFSEMYLNYLGFDITNSPFENHSKFYRNSLVRANYRNAQANIFPDFSYLLSFYNSILYGLNTSFENKDLICKSLFDAPELLRNVGSK